MRRPGCASARGGGADSVRPCAWRGRGGRRGAACAAARAPASRARPRWPAAGCRRPLRAQRRGTCGGARGLEATPVLPTSHHARPPVTNPPLRPPQRKAAGARPGCTECTCLAPPARFPARFPARNRRHIAAGITSSSWDDMVGEGRARGAGRARSICFLCARRERAAVSIYSGPVDGMSTAPCRGRGRPARGAVRLRGPPPAGLAALESARGRSVEGGVRVPRAVGVRGGAGQAPRNVSDDDLDEYQ